MPRSWRLLTLEPTRGCHSSCPQAVAIIDLSIVNAAWWGGADPFAGSRTTGDVAACLDRSAILLGRREDYFHSVRGRFSRDLLGLAM